MAQTILGIDLGSYSVKIAQIQRTFGEFKLVNFFEVPLVAEEVLSYPQAASAALRKFISDNPIPYDSCVVSLPGNQVSFRVLDLPFTNAKKIDQTIEFELESLIPFEIDDMLFDYSILSTGENSSKLLVTYVPGEVFKNFLNHMQSSTLDPRYVGVDTLDLSYLTVLGVLPPEGRYALLDMGHSKTNLIVVEGTTVKSARSLSWGGDRLNRVIEKSGSFNYEEAENFKHAQCQLEPGSDDPVLKAVGEEFESLSLQLKQSLFALYESGEPNIEALYLSGGTSKLPGVASFFSNRLNINVSPLEVLDDSFSDLHDKESARAVIPTAFAAALHGVNPSKGLKINFRRGEYGFKKDIEEMGGALKKVGVMAASVAVIGLIYFIISYMILSSQVDTMNQHLAKLVSTSDTRLAKKKITSAKKAISIIDGEISTIKEKLKRMKGDNTPSALRVLNLISGGVPPRDKIKVDIDNVNISPQRVRLEGRTDSYEAVEKLKVSLEGIPIFKNVQPGDTRKVVRDEIKFSISFDVVEEKEEGA